jgi:hypothetical protein
MDFARWRGGEIDPFELSDRIHRFHDGVSRDLYVAYRDLSPINAAARAIALQVLDRTEVPSEILGELESMVQFFEKRAGTGDREDEPGIESRDAHRRPGINARARNSAP